MNGKTTWWFPDGDLPEPVAGDRFTSHESLMVLNPNAEPDGLARLLLGGQAADVGARPGRRGRRVARVRIDRLEGVSIPYRTQYAIKLESDVGLRLLWLADTA